MNILDINIWDINILDINTLDINIRDINTLDISIWDINILDINIGDRDLVAKNQRCLQYPTKFHVHGGSGFWDSMEGPVEPLLV